MLSVLKAGFQGLQVGSVSQRLAAKTAALRAMPGTTQRKGDTDSGKLSSCK